MKFRELIRRIEFLHDEQYFTFDQIATVFNWEYFDGELIVTRRGIADIYRKYIGKA